MTDLKPYVETIFNVYLNVFKKAKECKNKKLIAISTIIYNYLNKLSIDHNIVIKELKVISDINMIPFLQYLDYNNIQLYDFNEIEDSDVNLKNEKDIERFVLTHVYYLTQNNKFPKTI
jgi:hypothetical protein